LVYCRIRYFLVRVFITKCFINSSRLFHCEVVFENKHMFCLWIHHVHICSTDMSSGLSNKGDIHSSVMGDIGIVLHGVDLLLILFLYPSVWFLLGCIVNVMPCILWEFTQQLTLSFVTLFITMPGCGPNSIQYLGHWCLPSISMNNMLDSQSVLPCFSKSICICNINAW
jgi:hypothetical protein